MKVWLGRSKVTVDPAASIGAGGEAEVFDLGDGRALKLFKTADHPELAGDLAAQRAAEARLDEHQKKLRDLPRDLGDRVITPEIVATSRRPPAGRIVGYAMRRIDGADLLYRYAEPRFRRGRIPGSRVVAILRDLHQTVSGLHDRGVVIGDFNDLNVLVRDTRAYLIDTDSFQIAGYPCRVFTERFVDPLLCDPTGSAPELVTPHGVDSDWYAFAVLAMRSLLCVGPYGGVHRPADPADRVGHGARPLARITVFRDDVVYPKPALHYGLLPDDLLDHLTAVFERDARGQFPADLLETLRWTRCRDCGAEHARTRCPRCERNAGPAALPMIRARGSVTARLLDGAEAAAIRERRDEQHRNSKHRFWIRGSSLCFEGAHGEVRIGGVVGGRARFWVGETLGAGFYSAGALTVGFVFDARRPRAGSLDDQVALPPLRGTLMSAACAVGGDRAWLFFTEKVGPKIVARCVCVSASGEVLGVAEGSPARHPWLAAGDTACAVGPHLFAATDEGVVRLEVDAGQVAQTRLFADTEPFVDSSCRLAVSERGLCAIGAESVVALSIKRGAP